MNEKFDPELETNSDGEWVDEELYEAVDEQTRLLREACPGWFKKKILEEPSVTKILPDGRVYVDLSDPFEF